MNKAATVYTIYWDNTLVGFRSVLPMPSGTIKHAYRGNRLVVLPDYQNLGFGTRITEYIGELYLSRGLKYFMRSTHLRLRNHWTNSPLWRLTSSNNKVSNAPCSSSTIKQGEKDRMLHRVAYSAEYMGKESIEKPHLTIHIDDNPNIDYFILENDLRWLKEKYYLCIITGEINTPSNIEDICLKNGIRTQLLYNTIKGNAKIASAYKNAKIITKWDKEFSERIRRYYKNK